MKPWIWLRAPRPLPPESGRVQTAKGPEIGRIFRSEHFPARVCCGDGRQSVKILGA
jgi:hypothetical protein